MRLNNIDGASTRTRCLVNLRVDEVAERILQISIAWLEEPSEPFARLGVRLAGQHLAHGGVYESLVRRAWTVIIVVVALVDGADGGEGILGVWRWGDVVGDCDVVSHLGGCCDLGGCKSGFAGER